MAQKWQTISELAAETSRKVTHSPEEWCRFLTTAARFYKAYDFDDQLLILRTEAERDGLRGICLPGTIKCAGGSMQAARLSR